MINQETETSLHGCTLKEAENCDATLWDTW